MRPDMKTCYGILALLWLNVFVGYSYSWEPVILKTVKREQNIDVSSAYFERHEMHKLSLPSMKNLTTIEDSSLDCGFTCTRLAWCLSYNFQRSSDKNAKHRCEMLFSDKYNNSNDFQPNGEFDHFSILSPCSQSPCQNGGTCIALYNKNDFSCACTSDYIGNFCEVKYPTACKQIYEHEGERRDKAYLLKMENGKTSSFCHMTNLAACGGGGWTLVMKIAGSKSTFSYDSTYWSNKETYNLHGGTTGLDNLETKLPSYWNTPFTKLCLGMKVGADTRFILLHKQASSLYSLIADGKFRSTSLGRDKWKSLIAGSSLQKKCGKEGFNSNSGRGVACRARIGIIGNQEADCLSPDSFIGFGSGVVSYSCGNRARLYADNGNKFIATTGYIFVQ